jgi:hypothetical protein
MKMLAALDLAENLARRCCAKRATGPAASFAELFLIHWPIPIRLRRYGAGPESVRLAVAHKFSPPIASWRTSPWNCARTA